MERRPGSTTRVPMWSVSGPRPDRRADELATEEPMEIRVLTREEDRWVPHQVAVTMRTPGNDFELAVGFLMTEGVLTDPDQIERITHCDPIAFCTSGDESEVYNIVTVYLRPGVEFDLERLSRHVYVSSSCGICGKASLEQVRTLCPPLPDDRFRISREYLVSLPETLSREQAIFQRTGGLHAAALFDATGGLRWLREDVGRHNAMDKMVGAFWWDGADEAEGRVALVSGRASFELVQKALMARIPVLAAVGAPTSLAVQLAGDYGMTLVGFLREGRFNVYTGAERVAFATADIGADGGR